MVTFKCGNGVRQGGVASPVLFTIYRGVYRGWISLLSTR